MGEVDWVKWFGGLGLFPALVGLTGWVRLVGLDGLVCWVCLVGGVGLTGWVSLVEFS